MTQVGLVTILFTDLVDSTQLASELGPAEADDLRRAHFQSLREVIETHDGREVKNTGDGLMVAFDRPSDGAVCAVGLQRRTERFGRHRARGRVTIRIGLAVGEATSEDGDWFGTPVVEAARLCAAAEAGQILATDVVRTLGGGRSRLDFVSRGTMTLKGLPDPVAVVEVGWEPEPVESELPPLLASLGGPFFVGRDLESERLASAWKDSLDNKRRAVLVAGEPGVGKTRLVRELATRAQHDGATILYGRCDEELGLAYQPFVEALSYLVSTCDRGLLDQHIAMFGGELTRIVSEVAVRVPDIAAPLRADPELERHRLFEAVSHILGIAAEGGGLVLILDDLHWADKGSLLLMRHLLRAAQPAAMLVAGTYRDTDLARTHPLAEMLADFRIHDDVERLMLSGLDVAGVEAFVEAAAGQALNDDGLSLARAVHGETEGNPFFVGQVLRHLAESGAIFQRDGQWAFEGDVARLGIPEGVREVIGRRLNRLSDDVSRVLRTAAVIGREFDLGLVAEVDDRGEDDVVDALEAAVAARLVAEVPSKPDSFMFAHALVRESLYAELSTSRRTRLHKRIGEALERQRRPSLAALAYHFCEAAAMGEVDKAADYARRAGDDALDASANEEAVRRFARGIEVLDEAGERAGRVRIELHVGLAEALGRAGAIEEARHTAEAATVLARELGDAELFARAALECGVGVPRTVNEAGADLVAEALDRLADADSPLRALLLSQLARLASPRLTLERRREMSAEALAIARRVGDERTLADALATHHDVISGPANVEERLALADEMMETERTAATGYGYVFRWGDLFELGDIDGARRALADYEAHGVRTHERGVSAWAEMWGASLDLFAGHLDDAETKLMGWFGDHRGIDESLALGSFGVQFFALRRDQGRCAEVEPVIRSLVADNPNSAGWRCGLAMLMTDLDRQTEARELLEDLAPDDFALAAAEQINFTLNMALLAETCAYVGDGERASSLYEHLRPYAGRNIVVGVGQAAIGAATRYLGLLATTMERWDEAEQQFEAALAMNDRMGARPWLARTACDYAHMLEVSGRERTRRDELLARAAVLAREIGMPVLAQRVSALRA